MHHLLCVATGVVVVTKLEIAESLRARLTGLLGRSALEPGQGMLIRRCRTIHTLGMRFDLDLIFFDAQGRVIATRKGVPPGRICFGPRRATEVLELPAGQLKQGGFLRGSTFRTMSVKSS